MDQATVIMMSGAEYDTEFCFSGPKNKIPCTVNYDRSYIPEYFEFVLQGSTMVFPILHIVCDQRYPAET
jgi:hypothetical protein